MAEPTINTNFNFPNIDILDIKNDEGVLLHYQAKPQSGYVMYDRNDNFTEIDPITGEEFPVTYYRRIAVLPLTYNFANFPYIAVLESEVDENYIFGGGTTNQPEKS